MITKKKTFAVMILLTLFLFMNYLKVDARTDETVYMASLINEYRYSLGLPELYLYDNLENAAELRAYEQSLSFSHIRPDGSKWYTISSDAYGEILAVGFDTPEDVLNAWIESPSHNDLLIDSNFQTFGVGKFDDYYVVLFGYYIHIFKLWMSDPSI